MEEINLVKVTLPEQAEPIDFPKICINLDIHAASWKTLDKVKVN